jgi:tetratricopeptide (TPR) repeat protein
MRILFLLIAALTAHSAEDSRDSGIRFLEARAKGDPADFITWNQLGDRYLQRHRETGDDAWLGKARAAAASSLEAIPAASNTGGLAVSARVALAEHRFADARKHAEQLVQHDPGKPASLAILADALLESGDLAGAEKTITKLEEAHAAELIVATRRARLARLRGNFEVARQQYEAARAAADHGSAAFWSAWAEVQLGELAFGRGDWDGASQHYAAALANQPGWWSAQEHLAEVRAAQERDDEALKLFHEVVERLPKPELLQAIGDLHLFRGRKEEAKTWHDRALAAYERANAKGSIAYFHHLAGFYCDSQRNPAEAIKWARRDLELRDSAASRDALAWALYHDGQMAAARTEIEKALASNPADPHILHHAAMIKISSGDVSGGQAALRAAAAINPRYQNFHLHR